MCFLFFIIFIFTLLISQYNITVKIYGDKMIAIALSITRSKRSEITNRYYENATTINFKIVLRDMIRLRYYRICLIFVGN